MAKDDDSQNIEYDFTLFQAYLRDGYSVTEVIYAMGLEQIEEYVIQDLIELGIIDQEDE